MIFKKEHIKLILNGEKTQTRRVNRGYYQVGHDYAIQPCRTCKGIEGHRIQITEIGWETGMLKISRKDAMAEGGYTPVEFSEIFSQLNPKGDLGKRWAFKFKVVKAG